MARTSTRRWKGCQMCKYYKDDSYGDATRIPYSALKDFPTPDGHKVNRHDVGLWEGDDDIEAAGGFGPLALGGRDVRRSGRKNTRRWCKGKPGREHAPVFTGSKWNFRRGCRPVATGDWFGNKDGWHCSHQEVCANCGKILREAWQIGTDCPLYTASVTAA